jgi:uncharacterized BrkB/YihY/UPF0761 family membrane protein
MLNMKDLFGLMAAVSLLFVVMGFVRLGVDVYNYLHASNLGTAETTNAVLNYRGINIIVTGFALFCIFVLLYRWRKE